jgi:hypothetical protein
MPNLRPRPADDETEPPGLQRDKQKEQKASLRRVLKALRTNSVPEKRQYSERSAPRNTMTESGKEMLSRPVLEPLSRIEREHAMASMDSKKRHAALVRRSKHQAYGVQGAVNIQAELESHEFRAVLVVQEASRAWRRGKSKRDPRQNRGYTIDEVVEAVRYIFRGAKWMEYTQAYDEGRIRVPSSTVNTYFYGQTKVDKPEDIYVRGLPGLGPKRGLLSPAQEDFLLGIVVEMHLHRKAQSVHEIGRWVTITSVANGTVAADLVSQHRKFIKLFSARLKANFGFDLAVKESQQLSKARAGVLRSGKLLFAACIPPPSSGTAMPASVFWHACKKGATFAHPRP